MKKSIIVGLFLAGITMTGCSGTSPSSTAKTAPISSASKVPLDPKPLYVRYFGQGEVIGPDEGGVFVGTGGPMVCGCGGVIVLKFQHAQDKSTSYFTGYIGENDGQTVTNDGRGWWFNDQYYIMVLGRGDGNFSDNSGRILYNMQTSKEVDLNGVELKNLKIEIRQAKTYISPIKI